ncbi:MAG: hypothetical protein KTU85_08785 [Acidimicrobiia bacterium]|nr:hypothetical protein [Acidimicrobiia bacterium]
MATSPSVLDINGVQVSVTNGDKTFFQRQRGDAWASVDDQLQSLDTLLEWHKRDWANGLADARWPPVYAKQPNEPPRVAPSRAKKSTT